MKSDLYSLFKLNDILKYDDDTTLHVPEHIDIRLETEFNHIKSRASANKLHLNRSKSNEIVFRLPRIKYFYFSPAVGETEQLDCVILLGVVFQTNLTMSRSVHPLSSAQRMHLLKLIVSSEADLEGAEPTLPPTFQAEGQGIGPLQSRSLSPTSKSSPRGVAGVAMVATATPNPF